MTCLRFLHAPQKHAELPSSYEHSTTLQPTPQPSPYLLTSGGYPRAAVDFYSLLSTVLGTVLLTSAFFKAESFLHTEQTPTPLSLPGWLLIAVALAETILGSCLLLPSLCPLTRWVAFFWFGACSLVVLTKGLAGESTCGCFGRINVDPWLLLPLDIAAIVALWLIQPKSEAAAQPSIALYLRYSYFLSILLAGGFALIFLVHRPPLALLPATLNLGSVRQAETIPVTFSLANRTHQPVKLASVKTSCKCLNVMLGQTEIAPHEQVSLNGVLDLATEPNFVGRLAIRIRGFDEVDKLAFNATVHAKVVPHEE